MTVMVIALGIEDTPLPGNTELPYYEEIRRGLHETESASKIYSTWVGPTDGLKLESQDLKTRSYEFRTSWKDGHLNFGLMPQKLRHMLAIMLSDAIDRPGIDTLVLKRYKRQDVYVTQVMTDTTTNIFVFTINGN